MHPFSTTWNHIRKTTVFWCLQGVEKRCIGNEWVNYKCGEMEGSIRSELSQSIITSNLLSWVAAEAATRGVLRKKMFLKISQNSQENPCARVSFLTNFVKKKTLAQVFSCEFCKMFKNTCFEEHVLLLYLKSYNHIQSFCKNFRKSCKIVNNKKILIYVFV